MFAMAELIWVNQPKKTMVSDYIQTEVLMEIFNVQECVSLAFAQKQLTVHFCI